MSKLTIQNADKIAKLSFDLAIAEGQTPNEAQLFCEYMWLVATSHADGAPPSFKDFSANPTNY